MTKKEMLLDENKRYVKAYSDDLAILNDKVVLVAGASGLIGSHLIKFLLSYNELLGGRIKVVALGRNKTRLEKKLGTSKMLRCMESDYKKSLDVKCDYVINCASNTSSESFIHTPANTILDNIAIMKFTLDIAKENSAKYLYTSSQEIYGNPYKGQDIFSENELGFLSTSDVRNSYPETKRISELLVWSYANQYGINANSVRLAKCYALDSDINDRRVVADFTRKAGRGEDIILKTEGRMQSTFAYVLDIVAGMIYVLTRCYDNAIYNIGSDGSDYSIKELAELIATLGGVNVAFDLEDNSKTGYAKVSHMLLSLEKIHDRGWHGLTNLENGIKKILDYNELD